MRIRLFLAALLCFPGLVFAGPNTGGVLVVHDAHLSLAATNGSASVCSQVVAPAECREFDAEIESSSAEDPKVWIVYAVFPDSANPRLSGISWGIHYSPDSLALVASGRCGDFETNDGNWPGTDTGSEMTWSSSQTELVVPVYWFAGYQYTSGGTSFATRDYPGKEGVFGDDNVPAALDPIAGYGTLGFGIQGNRLCSFDSPGTGMEFGVQNYTEEPEINLPEFDLFNYTSPEIELARAAAEDSVEAHYQGTWRVYSWNPQTNTPGIIYGTGFDVTGSVADSASAATAGFEVLEANQEVLGVTPADLRVSAVVRGHGKCVVHFQQTYGGLDVVGGGARVAFTEQGRLLTFGASFYPELTLSTAPGITSGHARAIARNDLDFFNSETDYTDSSTPLVILPVPVSASQVDPHLAYQVTVRTADPTGVWTTYMDGDNGTIYERRNQIRPEAFLGTATCEVERTSPCFASNPEAASFTRIEVGDIGTTNADERGYWTVPYEFSDSQLVVATLQNDFTRVTVSGGGYAHFSRKAAPGTPLAVVFDSTNSLPEERDTYKAICDAHTFLLLLDPDVGSVLDPVYATVNADCVNPCNAYGWAHGISLCREAMYCVDYGRVFGIIHHEYGHALNHSFEFSGAQGLDEGSADILANLLALDDVMARGAYYPNDCGRGIRDSENSLVYPEDVIGHEAHAAGTVIAGFQWDATEEMIRRDGPAEARMTSGHTWHWARKLHRPASQPEQVFFTFMEDDDDGDFTDGTPNFEAYRQAAINHHFDPPGTLIQGACCNVDGTCSVAEWSDCPGSSVWHPETASCSPSPCAPLGAAWGAMGAGFDDGAVRAIIDFDGVAVAGGTFTRSDSLQVGRVAAWIDSTWTGLGNGMDGPVYALCAMDGKIYAGGEFSRADSTVVSNVAVWDGSSWSSLGNGLDGPVRSLVVFGGNVVAGGDFEYSGATAVNHVAVWNRAEWDPLEEGTNGNVNALTEYSGTLVAAGLFSVAGGDSASNIARWDGVGWHRVGEGLDGEVNAITAGGGVLYAGGAFSHSGDMTVNHIARCYSSHWDSLRQGTDGTVYSLTIQNQALVVGGSFLKAGGHASAGIARCWVVTLDEAAEEDSSAFWSSFSGDFNGTVYALGTTSAASIIAGGTFTEAGTANAHRISLWAEYPAYTEEQEYLPTRLALTAVPNPARRGGTSIAYDLTHPGHTVLEIFDVGGARVRRLVNQNMPAGRHTAAWDGRDAFGRVVSAGVYFARVSMAGHAATGRVIVVR